jgi:hypothetical protein
LLRHFPAKRVAAFLKIVVLSSILVFDQSFHASKEFFIALSTVSLSAL